MITLRSTVILLAGILIGAGGGIYGTWRYLWKPAEPHHEVRYHEIEQEDEGQEVWLLPPGSTLGYVYEDAEVLAAIQTPESIEFHRVEENGKLTALGYKFSEVAAKPDKETTERLIYALGSLSSYQPPSACGFSPAVLMRLRKNERTFDFVFCFHCGEIHWTGRGGVGMTDTAQKVFLKCFCDTFPEDAELREVRKKIFKR